MEQMISDEVRVSHRHRKHTESKTGKMGTGELPPKITVESRPVQADVA